MSQPKKHFFKRHDYQFVLDNRNIEKVQTIETYRNLSPQEVVDRFCGAKVEAWIEALQEQGIRDGQFFVMLNLDPAQTMLVSESDVVHLEPGI